MGSGRFSDDDWKSYSSSQNYDKKSTHQIFTSSSLNSDVNPKGVVRESRDSGDNPNSTPIIIASDVTGSMGFLSGELAKNGIPTLCKEIYNRKPVSDPHILCAAVGDFESDQAPLQVTQFEADIRISQQLEKLWLEGGGGGNGYESYAAAWLFAAMQTKTDAFEKRGKKGYLFTFGDEGPTPRLRRDAINSHLGLSVESDMDMSEILTLASRQWEIFHVIIAEGSYARNRLSELQQRWQNVLGERVLTLTDHTKLAEVVVSAIQVIEGADHSAVVGSWDGTTSLVVREATKSLTATTKSGSGGVAQL